MLDGLEDKQLYLLYEKHVPDPTHAHIISILLIHRSMKRMPQEAGGVR